MAVPHVVKVLTCTCRGTMPYAPEALEAACGASGVAHELCRADIGRFRSALDGPVMVTCTQEAPTFRIAAAEAGRDVALHFVNIREAAGWSDQATRALPKISALVAQAQILASLPEPATVTLESAGVTLIYGNDERALQAAEQLRDRLDLTVMLTGPAAPSPLRVSEFPVVKGTIRRATGHLGAFELVVDGFATAVPSSRASLLFEKPRDNALSRCDLIIDLTGGVPLFAAAREGYLRPDPDDAIGVQKALFAATDLVGQFDKPRPVVLDPAACAHERSGQNGCNRCLDNCPVSAISPAGDAVVIDPAVCAGCGTCAAMCPTDAIRWTVPNAEATARRFRSLLGSYRQAGAVGGRTPEPPVLLLHDIDHGGPLIDMLARAGDGLPSRVIPLLAPQVLGLDALASAFAFGAAELRLLLPARRGALRDSWEREVGLLDAVLQQLGYGEGRIGFIETDDPFILGEELRALPVRAGPAVATVMPTGRKRDVTLQALDALAALAPAPLPVAALPAGAPFGRIHVADGCTLCLSCVSACPTSALRDDPEKPRLRFIENNCVQCGLCASTCPENVITLEPRIVFGQARRTLETLREAEPALCISCSKPFGVKASIDRVAEKLVGQHWMFSDPSVIERIRMCGDCRMRAQVRQGLDPYAAGPRPATRTVDDYR